VGAHHPRSDDSWQPATSRPGELFTVEGQLRSGRAFARGLRNRDPRLHGYRRAMLRKAAMAFGAAVVIAVAVVVITALA
jgi:hypothetical protein